MSEKKSMLDGEKQYHIQLKEGDIADFVILPGDPGRVDSVSYTHLTLPTMFEV